ncbi:MAG: hypothetical protein ONB46_10990 [candidate division KSB1 bacterium]|nr:hypothetical protein [candidate division KSB1 bacterium]MDZ7366386.1 hypothetical protein [candidate division KSB1 bacterium]MDZ7404041.1 hypothetical protein [candidate division KSB1 bacterium]
MANWRQDSGLVNLDRTRWNLAHRLQGGWEYDSNIYESPSRRAASGSARFLLSTHGDRRANRWHILYNYAAALQTYPSHGNENKLSHDLHGKAGARVNSWLHLSAKAGATLKFYLENAADYGATSGSAAASFFLPHHLVAELGGETGQLDYAATDLYDFTFTGVEITLQRRWPRHRPGVIELLLNRRTLLYQRRAFEYNQTAGLLAKNTVQRDALTTMRAAVTHGRKIVAQVAVEAQINRSNSFGYDFSRFRLSGLLGFRPAQRWMFRAAGLLQYKRYRDDLARLNLRDLDTEREQSNFLVIDLSRDLSPEISLVTRAAFYNNESIVPGKFYHKTLLFLGLESRL